MRKTCLLVASLVFAGAFAANAQGTSTQQQAQPPASTPAAPSEPETAPKIQRFNVVDVSELPQETQKQVEQVVAQGSEDNLKQLRSTIDATPEAKAALDAKGATSAQVVATAVSKDGTLTLITKKKS
jgi:hypothetical protein